jgi:hypothetical protein
MAELRYRDCDDPTNLIRLKPAKGGISLWSDALLYAGAFFIDH